MLMFSEGSVFSEVWPMCIWIERIIEITKRWNGGMTMLRNRNVSILYPRNLEQISLSFLPVSISRIDVETIYDVTRCMFIELNAHDGLV